MIRRVLVAGGISGLTGCALIAGLGDGYTSDADGGPAVVSDAPAGDTEADVGDRADTGENADAGQRADAASLDTGPVLPLPDAAGNLLTDPGFELMPSSGIGCGADWSIDNVSGMLSTTAHTGHYSCMICPGTNPVSALTPTASTPSMAGKKYTVSAYIRAVAPVDGGTSLVGLNDTPPHGTAPQYDHQAMEATPNTSMWLGMTYTTPAPLMKGETVAFRLLAIVSSSTTCLLVDDVSMYEQ